MSLFPDAIKLGSTLREVEHLIHQPLFQLYAASINKDALPYIHFYENPDPFCGGICADCSEIPLDITVTLQRNSTQNNIVVDDRRNGAWNRHRVWLYNACRTIPEGAMLTSFIVALLEVIREKSLTY
jgi:hypothetical protein